MTKNESTQNNSMDDTQGVAGQPDQDTTMAFSNETDQRPGKVETRAPSSSMPWEGDDSPEIPEKQPDVKERAPLQTDKQETPTPPQAFSTNGKFESKLTEEQWKQARIMYEEQESTHTAIGAVYGLHSSTISGRARRDGWCKDPIERKRRKIRDENRAIAVDSTLATIEDLREDGQASETRLIELKNRAIQLGNIAYEMLTPLIKRITTDLQTRKGRYNPADLKAIATALKDLREASLGKAPLVGVAIGAGQGGSNQAILAVPFLPAVPRIDEPVIDVQVIDKNPPPDPFAV